MERLLSFKDWMLFLEGSFTEADIPAYFYVGCYFSEDFLKHYPFTPAGAACSLVGLEGLSANTSTATSFSNGAVVKMPGKAMVDVNKVSRVMNDNPHYRASAGFRATRRTRTGNDPLHSHKKNSTTVEVAREVLQSVMNQIRSNIPELRDSSYSGYGLKATNGTVVGIDNVIEALKKTAFRKANIWGTRRSKPERAIHNDDNLKNIRSADDLALRILAVLRPLVGNAINKAMEPSGDKDKNGRDIPKLFSWVRYPAQNVGAHPGEAEWVTKRQTLPGVKGKHCPHCHRFNPVDDSQIGQKIACRNCGEEIDTNGGLVGGSSFNVEHSEWFSCVVRL